jgi:aminoglycoside 6'-N-acetyltransferase I
MKIVALHPNDRQSIMQVANPLIEGFQLHSPHAWPDKESALSEVQESFAPDRISRIAIADDGTVLGWIGAISAYDGHAWELHPLVVRLDRQDQGIGRALVSDLEGILSERGATTIYLGTDDEDNMTTLSGVDLYPNVLEHLSNIKNLRGHPYSFYQKLGYVIVGAIPDANGPGKPDILMAKRLSG